MRMKIIDKIKYVKSRIPNIPKSIVFNFYYLPLKEAVHFPIYVGSNIKIANLGDRNSIQVEKCKRGTICIGMSKGAHGIASSRGYWDIAKDTKIIFKGSCNIAAGGKIVVKPKGKLIFGDGCSFNANSLIVVKKGITFGDDCMASWNTSFLDDDGHKIIDLNSEKEVNLPCEIAIGNHVWIGEGVQVLKGAHINDNSVVAAGAMVFQTNERCGTNIVLAGIPAKVIKENINWSRDAYDI